MSKEIDFRSVMILQNDSVNFQRFSCMNEDDGWKNCLENPFTTATKAMMSINGDEESVAALSFLCDYYKVSKEKKLIPPGRAEPTSEQTKRNFHGFGNETSDLSALGGSANLMRRLTENPFMPQEYLDLDKRPHTLNLDSLINMNKPTVPSSPTKDNSLEGFVTASQDPYDKGLNSLLETILTSQPHQRWNQESTFKEGPQEPLLFTDVPGTPIAPICSDVYTPMNCMRSNFEYILGTPKAMITKPEESPMAYLNKGQFYPISLRTTGADKSLHQHNTKVKSVVMATFGNEKNAETQLKCWNHWHSRQPTAKQRVIDIADYKESFNTVSNIEEVAYNALSFTWDPNNEVKVYIGINCLSTDFSLQKGVKGLPLVLQVDTYDYVSGTNKLIHRAICQIKVFCDKGAERKTRDEQRRQSRKKIKCSDFSNNDSKGSSLPGYSGCDVTYLKPVTDLVSQPVLFIPEVHFSSLQRSGLVLAAVADEIDRLSLKRSCQSFPDEFCPSPAKQHRPDRTQRVLLYVRRASEEAFDALMLKTPDLRGLRHAISEKYGLPEEIIFKVYKKCKKGILVNMDDNIVQHYSDHNAFLLHITEVPGGIQITLTEI
ncbi:grainyhead-like protein 3 homolog [Latimeria chalumnae]|uniref:grainyhead-like protein 3 homolog n=1 Tax=Latimeria chalumnae TaxID=7897 RepID=UPI0003C1B230|nr:PREDICTED: grainyhead-like protein 3 homolog [Latimeria chalumnae]|eukprot:XP_005988842.1 PREDICTED: grainyhead-like protein 3 homolog [Latimeria chalumnae]